MVKALKALPTPPINHLDGTNLFTAAAVAVAAILVAHIAAAVAVTITAVSARHGAARPMLLGTLDAPAHEELQPQQPQPSIRLRGFQALQQTCMAGSSGSIDSLAATFLAFRPLQATSPSPRTCRRFS